MIIRKMERSDKKEVKRLFFEFSEFYKKDGTFDAATEKIEEYKSIENGLSQLTKKYFAGKKYFGFDAEKNGKIIGMIIGEVKKEPLMVLDKEGYVNEFFVTEDFRGKGVGKKLFERMTEEFSKHGCNHLGIDAFVGNGKAIELYRKIGFSDFALVLKKII